MDAKRRKKKRELPKPRAKEYTRRQNGSTVACNYVLVATRNSTPEDEEKSGKTFKKGDIRVGSSGHCYQRLNSHKRFGWLPIHIVTDGMQNPTARYRNERRMSRFMKSQIADGEDFDLINGDY